MTRRAAAFVVRSIQKYKDQFSFLRDAKFIRELENDSLDSDIIDEELNALREAAIRSYYTVHHGCAPNGVAREKSPRCGSGRRSNES